MTFTGNINERLYTTLNLCMLIALIVVLPGCGQEFHKSRISDAPIRVHEKKFARAIPIEALDNAMLDAIGQDYRTHGEGSLELYLTYYTGGDDNNAILASDKAAQIADRLRKRGVASVKIDLQPVDDQDKARRSIIRYTRLDAKKPAGCKMMPGSRDKQSQVGEVGSKYKLGCSVDTLTARQVVKPGDLLGRVPPVGAKSDGKRVRQRFESYRNEDASGGGSDETTEGDTSDRTGGGAGSGT